MSGKKRKHDQRQSDRDQIADRRRTSPCKTCCLNLGLVPRGSASHDTTVTLPDRQPPRNFLPSHQQVMALLLTRDVVPEEHGEFERHFWEVATGGDGERRNAASVGNTPLNWISYAYGCEYPTQQKHAGEMFPASGTASRFLDDFYIMHVILNRCQYRDETRGNDGAVRLVHSYKPEDQDDKNDYAYKFRATLLFLL